MDLNHSPFEEHIFSRYIEYRNKQILKPARFKLLFGLLLIISFGFIDILIKDNIVSLACRIIPTFVIALFFILDYLYFRKDNTKWVLTVYNSFFAALLFMIYGIFISDHIINGLFDKTSAEGIILISAITGVEIRGRLTTIMSIFVIPFVFFGLALIFIENTFPTETLIHLAHILTITVVMIIISYFLENKNFNTYKANIRLEIERNKSQTLYSNILEQNEEIESQKEEITVQRDLAQEQRQILVVQQKEITDSLEYATMIQRSLLPKESVFKNNFSEHFILFKPRNIVSGDFYWATQIKEWVIFAVADCTGHGVPAGFMSMLGFSYLKEIVNKSEITNVNEVLDSLRSKIIEVLDQKDEFGSAKDGMEIGLCSYNTKTSEMHFAGSNFSLLIIRDSKTTPSIELVRGDKMPISIYYKMKPFTSHKVTLRKSDTLYLYSDGYSDQFGGSLGKKIKSRAFKDLLKSTVNNSLSFQKELLEDYLNGWMNFQSEDKEKKYEQNDDITILGIRI